MCHLNHSFALLHYQLFIITLSLFVSPPSPAPALSSSFSSSIRPFALFISCFLCIHMLTFLCLSISLFLFISGGRADLWLVRPSHYSEVTDSISEADSVHINSRVSCQNDLEQDAECTPAQLFQVTLGKS